MFVRLHTGGDTQERLQPSHTKKCDQDEKRSRKRPKNERRRRYTATYSLYRASPIFFPIEMAVEIRSRGQSCNWMHKQNQSSSETKTNCTLKFTFKGGASIAGYIQNSKDEQ